MGGGGLSRQTALPRTTPAALAATDVCSLHARQHAIGDAIILGVVFHPRILKPSARRRDNAGARGAPNPDQEEGEEGRGLEDLD